MKQVELQELVENISRQYFSRPFLHEAIFNNRLRTTGGRYHLQTHHLDFNPRILEMFGLEIFEGIIKHELCHYHLHIEGKGYRHADADFKMLLQQVQGLRYTPSLEMKQETFLRWIYYCQGCQMKILRKRRFNEQKFICTQCSSHFKLAGREEVKLDDVSK